MLIVAIGCVDGDSGCLQYLILRWFRAIYVYKHRVNGDVVGGGGGGGGGRGGC